MDNDAARLFDQDRQRFLSIYTDFLKNTSVPLADRQEAAKTTIGVLRQIADLTGLHHG